MTESTLRAERFEPQSSAEPSYTWAVPQKPLSVRIPVAVIDRLEHEAAESFRSLHSRGSEIGGLLLGYVSPGDPAVVSIEDYEPIACDYSRGPLYRLSDADMGRLERAIEQRRAAGGLVVAGFFRSHTRKGLALDADDLALFKTRFADPRQVALLIRPFATKASTAGIFIWEDGAVRGEASHLEFPFRTSELTASKPVEEARQPLPEAAQPAPSEAAAPKPAARGQIVPIASRREITMPVPPPFIEVPAPEIEPEKNPEPVAAAPAPENNAWNALPSMLIPDVEVPLAGGPPAVRRDVKVARLAVAAAAGFVAIVLLFIYPGILHRDSRPAVSAQQDSSPLALRVEHSGGELMLTWNRESSAIKSATHAVLSISDGAQHENVDMDLALLRSGSIEYSPSGSDVVFRMEVTGADQTKTTSESVRILRTRPSPMPEPGQQAESSKGAPAPAATKPTGASSEADAPESASGQEPAAQAEARPTTTPAKPFNTDSLSQRLRPVRPTDMPDAPEVGRGGEAVSPAVPVGVSAMSAPQLISAPPPPATVPQSAPAQAANTARTNPSGGQVQQAQLISRKDPEYPTLAKQSRAQGEVILLATVGADGKVKDVKVLAGHPLLRNAAVAAVKQWVYKPTILKGKPVESETRISLNFVPR
jgi:TonB family protein